MDTTKYIKAEGQTGSEKPVDDHSQGVISGMGASVQPVFRPQLEAEEFKHSGDALMFDKKDIRKQQGLRQDH